VALGYLFAYCLKSNLVANMKKQNMFYATMYFLSVIPIGLLVFMSTVGYGAILEMVDGPMLGPPHDEGFLLWKEMLATTLVWSVIVCYLMTTLLLKIQESNRSAVRMHISQSIMFYVCLLLTAVPLLEVVVQMANVTGYVSQGAGLCCATFRGSNHYGNSH
jgi:hypothetical protein